MNDEFVKPVHSIEELADSENLYVPPKLSDTPRKIERVGASGAHGTAGTEAAITLENQTNRHFSGQQKNEIVLSFTRRHWITLIPSFILFCITLAAASAHFFIAKSSVSIVLSSVLYRSIMLLLIAVYTISFHRFFIRIFNFYLKTVIITNFRIVALDETLYFDHNRDSIDLREIQDIVVTRHGIVKTLLNYGELTITLASVGATKTLFCVPNPEYYFRKINKTKREYIMTRKAEKF